MGYNRDIHQRHSIRLREYDYASAGVYFLTICTHERTCLFGEIIDTEMHLNPYGQIVEEEWTRSGEIRQEVKLDVRVVMPNHFHGIVFILPGVGAQGLAPLRNGDDPPRKFNVKPHSLPSLVRGFKSAVKQRVNDLRGSPGAPIWQRNCYEHVIRNEADLLRVRNYIIGNPAQWTADRENPVNIYDRGKGNHETTTR